ncbi:MAG: hypothetical protein ACFCUT_19675 [Kiloniellaceae bacterium]
MLPLDSPRWSELTHAYGTAEDVPGMLKAAAPLPPYRSYKDEPYFSLWSALCHQGDIYSASYAALPHLVEIVRTNTDRLSVSLLSLIAAVESARVQGKGPAIPDYLSDGYQAVLTSLPSFAAQLVNAAQDEEACRAVLAVLAAAKGYGRISAAIGELSPKVVDKLLDRWIFE